MWGLGCRSSFEPRRWQNPTDGRFARKPTTVVAGHSGDTPVRFLDATNPSRRAPHPPSGQSVALRDREQVQPEVLNVDHQAGVKWRRCTPGGRTGLGATSLRHLSLPDERQDSPRTITASSRTPPRPSAKTTARRQRQRLRAEVLALPPQHAGVNVDDEPPARSVAWVAADRPRVGDAGIGPGPVVRLAGDGA